MKSTIVHQNEAQWTESKTLLDNNTYYIVHRNGPTVMNVRGETDEVYRVMIGSPHSCSCKKTTGFCVHILFVVLKVLRIPEDHPIAKKLTLTDSEIDLALAGNFGVKPPPIVRKEKKIKGTSRMTSSLSSSSTAEDIAEDTVERQPMDDENPDICPICQDDMSKDDALTWCRKGCGNNIHAKCMKLYAQYKSTNSTNILCPLCREDWGPNAIQILNDDCKGRASLKKACSTSQCHTCTFQIKGDLFRCVECSLKSYQRLLDEATATAGAASNNNTTNQSHPKLQPVDFCSRCFQNISREHARHHLITSSATELLSDFEWKYVKNPRAPQQLIDENILTSLQQRDFTDEDYDLLLGFDQKSHAIPLQKVLMDSLQIYKTPLVEKNEKIQPLPCWCRKSLDTTVEKVYILPCGHHVHEQCISSLLDEAVSEGSWKLDDICCGFVNCKSRIFKGISRRRFKLKRESSTEEDLTKQSSEKTKIVDSTPSNSLLCGISGISLNGRHITTSDTSAATTSSTTVIGSRRSSSSSASPSSSSSSSSSQQKLMKSSSRNRLQRQLELQQKLDDHLNNPNSINQLCIGDNIEAQPIRSTLTQKMTRPPRNTGMKKMPITRFRSMTDDEVDGEEGGEDRNSSIISLGGVAVTRAASVDRSMGSSRTFQEEGSTEQRNRIPIRKKNHENLMQTKGQHQLPNDTLDSSTLSLGGVGIGVGGGGGGVGLHGSSHLTTSHNHNNNQNQNHNHHNHQNMEEFRQSNQRMVGKRIKSSPAGLIAAKRKLQSMGVENTNPEEENTNQSLPLPLPLALSVSQSRSSLIQTNGAT